MTIVYLKDVGSPEDPCWAPCAKSDPGATEFSSEFGKHGPRAYTPDECRDVLVKGIRTLARYWAELEEVDPATGRRHTVLDRCEGVAFSILSTLDGCGTTPHINLIMDPHPDDKEYHINLGENYFEPGTVINGSLHEVFYPRRT